MKRYVQSIQMADILNILIKSAMFMEKKVVR